MGIYSKIKRSAKLKKFKRDWRQANKHNYTVAGHIFDPNKVQVGNDSYGTLHVLSWRSANELLKIASHCSIGPNVRFFLGGNHDYSKFSTYAFRFYYKGEKHPGISKGTIEIESGVWIGHSAVIMSGITIGEGAIVGAYSVVASDVPPYSIVVGNPAKVVKYRFPKEQVEALTKLNVYEHVNKQFYLDNAELFENKIDDELIARMQETILNEKK